MHVPTRVIRPHFTWAASSPLPTKYGEFLTHVFHEQAPGSGETARITKEHVAMVYGNVAGSRRVPVRVHSECMTSEVFGSLKCDCKDQLDNALALIARRGAGAVLYLRQEGRGIGLANKIRAYDLQSRGHDTVDANRMLGLPDDARTYDVAALMLEYLGIASIELLTNNPEKVSGLRACGIEVEARIPHVVAPNEFSRGYLEAKRLRMAHALPVFPAIVPLRAVGDAE